MDLAAQMDGSLGRWTELSGHNGLVVCLNGPAGAGKTQLALAYAYRKAEEFTSVFWIAAENTQSIELGFYGIGSRLLKHYSSILSESWNLPEQSATLIAAEMLGFGEVVQGPDCSIRPPTSQVSHIVTEAVRDWFNRADNTNWLLILDSMDEQGAAPLQTLSTYDYLKLATSCLHRGYRDTAETVTDYARQRLSKPELHTEVSVRLLEMYIELKRTTKAEALFKRMHRNTTRAANFRHSFQKLEARMSELSGRVDETISLLRNIMMKQDQLSKND